MRYLFILVLLVLASCGKSDEGISLKHDNFITEPGTYYFSGKQLKLKEFTDGSLTFGVSLSGTNKVLYEHSMFKAFSKYQFWRLYVDDKDNIWFYDSDYHEAIVLVWDDTNGKHVQQDFMKEKENAPKAFADAIADSN